MLKSKVNFPPNGWEFYQPETNWRANPHVGFDQVVAQIIEHRKANPRFNLATDRDTVNAQLETHTEARIRATFPTQVDQWIVSPAPGGPEVPFFMLRRPRPQGAAAALANPPKRKIMTGVGVIWEWLGGGLKPVAKELAESRAGVCVTCVENKDDPGILQTATEMVAGSLHELMEAKAGMELKTSHDPALKVCAVCKCVNTLKVWVPLEHIRGKTKPETLQAFPSWCWVRNELAAKIP